MLPVGRAAGRLLDQLGKCGYPLLRCLREFRFALSAVWSVTSAQFFSGRPIWPPTMPVPLLSRDAGRKVLGSTARWSCNQLHAGEAATFRWSDCPLFLQGPRARHDRPAEIRLLLEARECGRLRALQSRRLKRAPRPQPRPSGSDRSLGRETGCSIRVRYLQRPGGPARQEGLVPKWGSGQAKWTVRDTSRRRSRRDAIRVEVSKPTRLPVLCAIDNATRFQFCASTLLFASRSRRRASAYARTAYSTHDRFCLGLNPFGRLTPATQPPQHVLPLCSAANSPLS